MPIIKSAIKRMKQTAVRRARNIETKKSVKSAVRAFTDAPSFKGLSEAQSAIDIAVKKNVLNKATAGRRKSNLVKAAKEAGVKVVATGKVATKTAVKATPKTSTKAAPAKKAPVAKTVEKNPVAKPVAKKAVAKKPATKK